MIIKFKFSEYEDICGMYEDLFPSIETVETNIQEDGGLISVEQIRIVIPEIHASIRYGLIYWRNPDADPDSSDVADFGDLGLFELGDEAIIEYDENEKDINKFNSCYSNLSLSTLVADIYYRRKHKTASPDEIGELECYIDTSEFIDDNTIKNMYPENFN